MYDKSKKTWSQRLKITKTERTTTTTTTTNTTALTAPSSPLAAATNNAHNFGRNQTSQYQTANSVTAMHLPTLQLQQLHDYHNGGGGGGGGGAYEYLPSALSRSMKYAEPWIYGTVRGIPARPYHHYVHQTAMATAPTYVHPHAAAIFAAHPLAGAGSGAEALAVVICSCPEYLNGTKRGVKKASVCKKCKGSRLPLAPYGGTMRLPTAAASGLKLRGSGAATVRVVSTSKKSRPTILDPKMDPYDLMRRTRLLSPEPSGGGREEGGGSSSKEKTRARGKSASPVRGRSRKRSQLASLPPKKQSSSSGETDLPDCWLVDDAETLLNDSGNVMASPSTAARRSILRCSVNPYDLISNKSTQNSKPTNASSPTATTSAGMRGGKQLMPGRTSQNEFMPPNDDFNVEDAALTEEAPPFAVGGAAASSSGGVARSNAANINHATALPKPPKATARRDNRAASTERGSKEATAAAADDEDAQTKLNYTNVQAIAGQRISLGERRSSKKSLIKQSEDGRCYESIIIAGDDEQQPKEAAQDAKQIAKTNAKQDQQAKQSRLHAAKAEEDRKRRAATLPPAESPPPPPTSTPESAVAAVKQCQPKRPPRVRKEETAASADSDEESAEKTNETESVTVLTVTPTQHIKSILKRPSSKSSECSDATSAADAATDHQAPSAGEALKSTATPTNQRRANSMSSSAGSAASPTANSQFYIPLPQAARKKVQFRVEERVIHALGNSNDKANEMCDEEENTQQQQQPHNAADNERSKGSSDETAEHEAAAEGQTRKSTANYEYYNRKRERQRLLRQQNAHKTTTTSTTACDSPTGVELQAQTQAALLTQLQHESDLVSHALNALNRRSNNNSNSNSGNYSANNGNNNAVDSGRNSSAGHKVYVDATYLAAFAESKTDPMHYEDIVAGAMTNSNNKNNNNKHSNRVVNPIMSDTSAKMLPAQCHAGGSPQLLPTPNVAAAISTTTTKAATVDDNGDDDGNGDVGVDTDEDVAHDDNDDDNDAADAADDVAKAKHATAATTAATTTARTARTAVAPKANDYDDDGVVATLQAFVASDSNARATQSRNPIRRSHSERQQPHNCNNNGNNSNGNSANNGPAAAHCKDRRRGSGNENTNKNNNRAAVLSFHDTMALRCRSNRNDSRDLFVRHAASSGMSRPREPPPPPPPTTPPPTSPISAKAATTAAAATARECNATAPTSKTTHALSFSLQSPTAAATTASSSSSRATNKGNHIVATLENAATAQVAENSKVALDKQQQQKQQQQQIHTELAAANAKQPHWHKDASRRAADSANLPNTATDKDAQQMAAAKPQQQQPNNNGKESNACQTAMCAITTPPGNSLPPSHAASAATSQQRTVVRVAPFNKTTSEVHRLKISHTDTEPTEPAQSHRHYQPHLNHHRQSPASPYSFQYSANGDATQKKTSILINGDDCYSTMNLSCDDASTPLYHSSVVVADYSASSTSAELLGGLKVTTTSNTVTINVSSPRSAVDELIYQHNKINTLLSRQAREHGGVACDSGGEAAAKGGGRAIIPIRGTPEVSLQRSASSTSSTSTSSMTSISSSGSGSGSGSIPKRGRTLIRLDYEKEKSMPQEHSANVALKTQTTTTTTINQAEAPTISLSHEEELLKILRNPVEAVKRNLVPHVCGRNEASSDKESVRNKKMQETATVSLPALSLPSSSGNAEPKSLDTPPADAAMLAPSKSPERNSSFIAKLLEDPMLSQVADGLESEIVAELIENSLKRLQESRSAIDMSGTKDSDDMNRLINLSLQKIKEERQNSNNNCNATNNNANANANANGSSGNTHLSVPTKDEDGHSNRGSISSANSFASANNNYEMFDFDANESDCYQSCSSEITTPGDDDASFAATRSKFYQMLVDATLAEIEISTNIEEDMESHHYESIRNNGDPIYEEIDDVPPPLPLTAPPVSDPDMDKKAARSIFEGASKYDILSYLVDAKERGVVREEAFDYPLSCSNPIIIEEEAGDTLSDLGKRKQKRDMSSRASILSDSSEDNQSIMSSLSPPSNNFLSGNSGVASLLRKGASSDIERNDSGVGSETSKSSRSKYQTPLIASNAQLSKNSPIHLCEDCDGPVETQVTESGLMFAPLVCRKCGKKRVERKEIITEIVETEEKYGRDLQIILEEFCHPMLVAGLLTQEQLSAIFLNTEELLENNQTLAERMRDALDIALEQGDDDLLTVNIGKIFLDFTQMLHAFESYCVRQAGASLLLANLEKEKELLRIFLKVSQMENAVLRRMNLNSFLMVPVQRVTKYPLLLARLYKVTPAHLEGRDQLKQAQEKIELHLNHINQEAKDVPTKLWRRISSSSPNRRASCEIDMINIKLRKMAIDILEWNHDEVRFAMEGKLLYTQPTDSNWKKARTIKLTPVNALLVTNGKPSANYKAEKVMSDKLNFPKHTGIREASLLVVKEKCGRYTLIREPLYLDRCVVCSEADWDDYFEVQEISSKDTFIFKAEDGVRTKQWYTQLQFHAQGMGAWRKRRNALANIMINGMLTRT